MNRENIQKLIEQLKKCTHIDPKDVTHANNFFNMCDWDMVIFPNGPKAAPQEDEHGNACHTPACIAGWACYLSCDGKDWFKNALDNGFVATASKWLGLDHVWCDRLFIPSFNLKDLTPEHAIAALETILKAGDEYISLRERKLWAKAHAELEESTEHYDD